MDTDPIVILPGLDGTDLLLEGFLRDAPKELSVAVNQLPDNPDDDYDTLCERISTQIRRFKSCHIIAESFSGPLGILLAERHPEVVNRLTLVASFAVSPTPRIARWIPWGTIFRLPMPKVVARHFFVGSDNRLASQLRTAIRRTSPQTLVQRMHCLMNVDVSKELAKLRCPLGYIRPKQDRLVSSLSVSNVVATNPTTVVRELDGPHLILQVRPKEAWSLILNGAHIANAPTTNATKLSKS